MNEQNEIVLYQPNELTKLEVRIEEETVWLSQQQMAQLFGVKENTITYHIKEIYKVHELQLDATAQKIRVVRLEGNRQVERSIDFYNLDMIISVGYRVNSLNATMFRRWATNVLKDYMLRGYAVNQRLLALEEKVDRGFAQQGRILAEHQDKIDFFVKTALPPAEQVFFEGNFFEARVALEVLVKTAKQRAIIIDGYVDALTFDILDVRAKGVKAEIYTNGVGAGMRRLMETHDKEVNKEHIEVYKWKNESHDRWLIIDDTLYHCGHSLNAMGKHLSAISQMGINPEDILNQVR
ncbi:MAG: virulence RhuM family protein [Paludibacteraceae bacterium]|nr:virulence RhuM family protein [Paludibacteraceae bacterium]